MNQNAQATSIDHRFIFLIVLVLSCLLGAVSERLLLQLSGTEVSTQVRDYLEQVQKADYAYPDLFRFALLRNAKLVLLLLLAGFTVAGFPLSLAAYALFLFRNAFFVAAFARQFAAKGFWISLASAAISFLFVTPMLYLCANHGYHGFQQCLLEGRRFYRMSKKQLQNFIKLGIIILLMMVLGALSEAYFCTFLLQRLLEGTIGG